MSQCSTIISIRVCSIYLKGDAKKIDINYKLERSLSFVLFLFPRYKMFLLSKHAKTMGLEKICLNNSSSMYHINDDEMFAGEIKDTRTFKYD